MTLMRRVRGLRPRAGSGRAGFPLVAACLGLLIFTLVPSCHGPAPVQGGPPEAPAGQSPTPLVSPEPPPLPQPLPLDAYSCTRDEDCLLSCGLGAVNGTWYRGVMAEGRQDCKDGCAGPGSDTARCVAGLCTAHDHRGLDLACTARSIQDPAARCPLLSRLFGGLLQGTENRCTTSSECGAYPAGVVEDCGGATVEASAVQLRRIGEVFARLGCSPRVLCAPRAVKGTECRNGRCAELLSR